MKTKRLIGRVTRWQPIAGCGEIAIIGKRYYFNRRGCLNRKTWTPEENMVVTFLIRDNFYQSTSGEYMTGAVNISRATWIDLLSLAVRRSQLPKEVQLPSIMFKSGYTKPRWRDQDGNS